MAKRPPEVSALLDSISVHFPKLLGEDLVGIYVYGSLTQRAFDPARSDIDLIVVTRRDIGDEQFERVGEWLGSEATKNVWTTRLQMMIIGRGDIFTMDARACHYQFGKFSRDESDGNPIPWINILKSGITLYGPRAKEFVPKVPSELVYKTMVRELGYLREELSEKPDSKWRDVPKYRAYAILTVCRILYTLSKSEIASKPCAASWAVQTLPVEWHPIVNAALEHDAGRPAKLPLQRIRKFVGFADGQLRGGGLNVHRDVTPFALEEAGDA